MTKKQQRSAQVECMGYNCDLPFWKWQAAAARLSLVGTPGMLAGPTGTHSKATVYHGSWPHLCAYLDGDSWDTTKLQEETDPCKAAPHPNHPDQPAPAGASSM